MAGGEGDTQGDGNKKVDLTYYLGSSDGPGNIITPIQLRGENYDEWARAIRISLKAKRKFGFVEGTVPKPTTEEKLDDWVAVHSMLVSWLTNTIEPSIRSTLGEYDDVQLLWNNLKNRFCVVSGTRICQLKTSLGECKQGKTDTVATYFGRLSKIWDELTTYVKVPVCKCRGCTCSIVTQVEKLRDEDYLHHFLIDLDGAYASIRTNLLGQEPLPMPDRAYQQVIQAERLRGGELSSSKDERDSIMAFAIHPDTRGKSRAVANTDKFCNHCDRDGHDESSCFQLHGFPEWWGDRPRGGKGPGRGGGRTGRGGVRTGSGHGRGSGRGSGAPPVRANKTSGPGTSSGQQAGNSQGLAGATEAAGLAGVSATQLQQLLDFLNLAKTKDRLYGPTDEEGDWSG
ncbi:hypothetical protein LguiB_020451 [Lonicera macranthoides]